MISLAYLRRSLTLERYKSTINESIVVSFLLGVYNYSPYYSDFLSENAKIILSILGILYILFVWTKTYISKQQNHLKYYLLYEIASNIIAKYFSNNGELNNQKVIPVSKKNDLLFLFVKIFYIPVMLNFTINNYSDLVGLFNNYHTQNLFNLTYFNWYGILVSIFFFVDTSYFLFGYLVESKKLGSTVRSVDKSSLSWLVTLACYPPFNLITAEIFPWVANDGNLSIPTFVNILLLSLILILFAIYLSATIALGSKCSNLTNRGTVCRGPYRFVRHPAYSSKIAAWWLMSLPIMNPFVFFSMTMWTVIYIIRALKEEDHLLEDVDYQNYYSKTPHRFIPKLF